MFIYKRGSDGCEAKHGYSLWSWDVVWSLRDITYLWRYVNCIVLFFFLLHVRVLHISVSFCTDLWRKHYATRTFLLVSLMFN
jgi:hypothetical protein